MHKIIGDTLYTRHPKPYAHELRIHDLGHGHLEAVVMPRYAWEEVGCLSPAALADHAAAQGSIWVDGAWQEYKPTQAELLDRAALNRERSARRAKTKVRRLCKHKGLTTMVTLTYRENMTDRARMARDFDVFVKRLRRVIPDFQYVCVFERQKRGAYHAHIAVPRVLSHYLHKGVMVKSYDLLRSAWRAVVGLDGGNIDVARSKRVGRSAARLASYLSKYIAKEFDQAIDAGDSYRASGRALPRAVVLLSAHQLLHEAAGDLVELLGPELKGCREFHQALLDCGGFFVVLSP